MTSVQPSLSSDAASSRGRRDRRLGVVTSDKGDKTIHVNFEFRTKHPKYNKYFRRSTTLHAHDEKNEAQRGDIVEVTACRRLSKTKCWRLTRIVRRGAGADVPGAVAEATRSS